MVDSELPPRPTGHPPEEVTLTGKVFPWEDGCPVFLRIAGSPFRWLPCFSDASKLRGFLEQCGVSHERIKVIDDHRGFIESFPRKRSDGMEIRLMIDPHRTEEGKIRYLQVLFD